MQQALSERQRREREYYDQYSQLTTSDLSVDFAPVQGGETRPWNSYWFFYQRVRELREAGAARLLDFGCGPGYATALYAKLGYEIRGFDISANNIVLARQRLERYGFGDRAVLEVGVAESLPHPDGAFDVVAGVDVLHHVDIPRAIAEVRRVLKPGGVALFHEPIVSPGFDAIRNTALMRRLVPNTASFERHVTHDERKLDGRDLETLRRHFAGLRDHRFRLLSRLARVAPGEGALTRLERFDRWVLGHAGALKPAAGIAVLELRKA